MEKMRGSGTAPASDYDGVDLARFAPFAWFATFGLGLISNFLAQRGYELTNPRLQSLMLVTLFLGFLALVGTTQILHRMRAAGRYRAVGCLVTAVVACSVGVVLHGLSFVAIG
ncbi:MAG: hypothetical protein NZ561_11955 [Phycisphaerae bacterium]|nr:hypothetical protein [Phycisphaerae bacterium]MDW8261439.1 hypothetical protein [Phycisphaerales bacterium]